MFSTQSGRRLFNQSRARAVHAGESAAVSRRLNAWIVILQLLCVIYTAVHRLAAAAAASVNHIYPEYLVYVDSSSTSCRLQNYTNRRISRSSRQSWRRFASPNFVRGGGHRSENTRARGREKPHVESTFPSWPILLALNTIRSYCKNKQEQAPVISGASTAKLNSTECSARVYLAGQLAGKLAPNFEF